MPWPTSIGMDFTCPPSVDPGYEYRRLDIMCATTMTPMGSDDQMLLIQGLEKGWLHMQHPDAPYNRRVDLTYDKKPVPVKVEEEKPKPWWKRIFGAKVTKI